jgi:hypothetical protein
MRNKFLTKVIGEWKCKGCESPHHAINFSTPDGFFKLKDFMCNHPEHERFFDGYIDHITERTDDVTATFDRIIPDDFANFAYDFLTELEALNKP